MLKWTEEDVKFVVKELLVPVLEEHDKIQDEADKILYDSYSKLFDLMATRIRELDYDRMRDRAFFLSYLGKLDRLYDVNKIYKEFCEEYDKHNKHLLNVGETND